MATSRRDEWARFLTRDPLVDVTMEPYGYAGNNPVNYVDPAGLNKCEVGANPVRWYGNAQECVEDLLYGEDTDVLGPAIDGSVNARICPTFGCVEVAYDVSSGETDVHVGVGVALALGVSYTPSESDYCDPQEEGFVSVGPIGYSTTRSHPNGEPPGPWSTGSPSVGVSPKGINFGFGLLRWYS